MFSCPEAIAIVLSLIFSSEAIAIIIVNLWIACYSHVLIFKYEAMPHDSDNLWTGGCSRSVDL